MYDYRFDFLAYGLRRENTKTYAFTKKATNLLAENYEVSTQYGEELWDEFWEDLELEHAEENRQEQQ